MTIVHVQGHALATSSSPSSIAITGSAVGSGNAIVGAVSWGSGTTLTSVTDDKGNSYTIFDSALDSFTSQNLAMFVLGNITNAPSTITANFNLGSTFPSLIWDEYSGIAALSDPRDGHTTQIQTSGGTSTDAISSGSITTTVDGDLIWVNTMEDGGVIPSAGTGFTLRASDNGGGSAVAVASEDLVQSTAGSISGTFTTGTAGQPWFTAVVALKAAAAALSNTPYNPWPQLGPILAQ